MTSQVASEVSQRPLSDLTFVVLDVETTGLRPDRGEGGGHPDRLSLGARIIPRSHLGGCDRPLGNHCGGSAFRSGRCPRDSRGPGPADWASPGAWDSHARRPFEGDQQASSWMAPRTPVGHVPEFGALGDVFSHLVGGKSPKGTPSGSPLGEYPAFSCVS